MGGLLQRAMAAATAAIALAAPALAQRPAIAPVPLEIAAAYVRPHDLIDVGGGRKLNLFCMGSGKRTVLFDSGLSDWSVIWALVQPEVAKDARACTYDRAGLGFSDASPDARTPVNIVEDMHALIRAAKLAAPLVVVGHSLGGFNMKLLAALHPEDVAGIVLVDPSEDRDYERTRAMLQKRYGIPLVARMELMDKSFIGDLAAHFDRCAQDARDRNLDPKSETYRKCTDPVREPIGERIRDFRISKQVTAQYQAVVASEFRNSVYGNTAGDGAYRSLFRPGAFGDKPMIVLSHGIYDKDDPIDAAGFAQFGALHRETAALSRRGQARIVPDTHHNIEIDDPQAIVSAVREVLHALDAPPTRRSRR